MDGIALGARLLLAIVFMTAAVGKFADQPGAERALEGFGVSRRWTHPLALLLPVAELAAAVALMFHVSGRWGAVGALVLLGAFIVGIAMAMARGEAPDCHCFGQIHSAPAGWRTLLRNAALSVVAVFVVAHGPGSQIVSSNSNDSSAELLAAGTAAALLALGALAVHLWIDNRALRRDRARDQETLSVFPPGLPVGAPAPRFELPSVDGRKIALDDLLARGHPVAIAFISPSCVSCRMMLPDLARWQKVLTDRITIAPVSSGSIGDIQKLAHEYGLKDVLVQRDADVFDMYRAPATPSVVIVTPEGRIGSRLRASHAIVEAVIRRQLQTDSGPNPPAGDSGEVDGGTLPVLQWNAAQGSP